jgi:hypothetical protein
VSDKSLEKRVEEWVKTALSVEVEPSLESEEWDWMDEEYARRKLGLKEVSKRWKGVRSLLWWLSLGRMKILLLE